MENTEICDEDGSSITTSFDVRPDPSSSHFFLDCALEIRRTIYDFYFQSDITIGCKTHPRTIDAVSLLMVNHQIHDEAEPMLYKLGTFTISAGKDYAPRPLRSFPYLIDHHVRPEEMLTPARSTIAKFQNIEIVMDPTDSPDTQDWWQHSYAVVIIAMEVRQPSQRVTIKIRTGDPSYWISNANTLLGAGWQQFRNGNFIEVTESNGSTWRERASMSNAELRQRGRGRSLLATYGIQGMEIYSFMCMILSLATFARAHGNTRLESIDHQRTMPMTANDLEKAFDQIREMQDKNGERDCWLVIEAP